MTCVKIIVWTGAFYVAVTISWTIKLFARNKVFLLAAKTQIEKDRILAKDK